jgi:hypothetical protein
MASDKLDSGWIVLILGALSHQSLVFAGWRPKPTAIKYLRHAMQTMYLREKRSVIFAEYNKI